MPISRIPWLLGFEDASFFCHGQESRHGNFGFSKEQSVAAVGRKVCWHAPDYGRALTLQLASLWHAPRNLLHCSMRRARRCALSTTLGLIDRLGPSYLLA